jgi:membrane associated rhomboid family serine protease
MNRAFLVIIIPAALVIAAYFLLAAYAGLQLTYARATAGLGGFGVSIYLVNVYLRRRSERRKSATAAEIKSSPNPR